MFQKAFIWLMITGTFIQSIDASHDYNWSKMNIESSRILVGKVYERINGVRSRIECQSLCLQSRCKSYNYARKLDVCELNNVTKEEADPTDFQENTDYIYADDNDGDVCTNRECCLNNSTNKNKDNFCFTQIALEKQESLSTSTSVAISVLLIAGRADHISVTCSEGISSHINVPFSQDVTVTCDDVPPASALSVTVSVSYLDFPPATITMTIKSKTSPVTLKETFTNSTAAAASWSLPEGEFADEFNVTCSNGYLTLLGQGVSNGSAICHGLVPGSVVKITVYSITDSVAGDSANLTMYLAPDSVTFTNLTSSLISASVEWYIVSGSVSTFVANCSRGNPVIETVDRSGSVECLNLSPGSEVNVTVVAIQNSKNSLPASITISTVPDSVFLYQMEDVSQFQALFNESGQSFAVAMFNLTSGTADLFRITCSEPAVMTTIDDPFIAMCVLNDTDVLEIEITVKAEKDGKIGKSSSINVTVIHPNTMVNDDTGPSSDDLTTVQDIDMLTESERNESTVTDSTSLLTEVIFNESSTAFDERFTADWSQTLSTVEEKTLDIKSTVIDATTVLTEIGPINESPTSSTSLPYLEGETRTQTSVDQQATAEETTFINSLTNVTQTATDVTQTITGGSQTTGGTNTITGGTNTTTGGADTTTGGTNTTTGGTNTTGGMKTTENGTESQTTTEA